MEHLTDIFKALADPTRLRIVLLLRRRELCVCEIMHILSQEQSRVSHQMRILRDAGLAEDIRQGRWIVYRVPSAVRSWLEGLFDGPLRAQVDGDQVLAVDLSRLEVCLRENVRRACKMPRASRLRPARSKKKSPREGREGRDARGTERQGGRS